MVSGVYLAHKSLDQIPHHKKKSKKEAAKKNVNFLYVFFETHKEKKKDETKKNTRLMLNKFHKCKSQSKYSKQVLPSFGLKHIPIRADTRCSDIYVCARNVPASRLIYYRFFFCTLDEHFSCTFAWSGIRQQLMEIESLIFQNVIGVE